jgi:hypothetical protein
MKKWAFIYTLGDKTAPVRTDIVGSPACQLVSIGVPSVEAAPAIAARLPDEGVELIELCGAFCGAGLGAVVEAVKGRVPVGGVFYGCEAAGGLQKLFG